MNKEQVIDGQENVVELYLPVDIPIDREPHWKESNEKRLTLEKRIRAGEGNLGQAWFVWLLLAFMVWGFLFGYQSYFNCTGQIMHDGKLLEPCKPIKPIIDFHVALVRHPSNAFSFAALAAAWPAIGLLIIGMAQMAIWQRFLRKRRTELRKTENKLRLIRTSTVVGKHSYLREQIAILADRTAKVFFQNKEHYEKAAEWCSEAWKQLAETDLEGDEAPSRLSEVESKVLLIRELIERDETERKHIRSWQLWSVAVILLYITVVAFLTIVASDLNVEATWFVGVPLPVVIWAAIGSLSAILYRFYSERGTIRLSEEVRWLIARPIIGVIMGGLAYLALTSGLLIFAGNGGSSPIRSEVLWIVAFLAGFSDRFYNRMIELLLDRTFTNKDATSNQKMTDEATVKTTGEVGKGKTAGLAKPA